MVRQFVGIDTHLEPQSFTVVHVYKIRARKHRGVPSMNRDQTIYYTTWLLRLIGGSICLAFFTIFFPLGWMQQIHAGLGLGEIPDQPIFEYLTRSLSSMYFAHGCVVLLASSNVVRFLPLVWLVCGLNLLLGAILLVTDLAAPMPWFWTILEGPPIILVGLLLFWLTRKLQKFEEQAMAS